MDLQRHQCRQLGNIQNSKTENVKYKKIFLSEIEVNEYGSCVTPLLFSEGFPIAFYPESRYGWVHTFGKDHNISNDYWVLNSVGITNPLTGTISGVIYYLKK